MPAMRRVVNVEPWEERSIPIEAFALRLERSPTMKTTVLLMALVSPLAMFAVAEAFAQNIQVEETEIPTVAPDPPQLEREAEPRPVARARRSSRANRDARHCLDLHTNHEIIKCAEKYL